MALSDCNKEMQYLYSSTPLMSLGQISAIPDSPYSVKFTAMNCNYAKIIDYTATVELRKSNVLIGTATLHPGGSAVLLDNQKFCIKENVFDCEKNQLSVRAWWNPTQKELVTNLDLPEAILNDIANSDLKYVSRYTEGQNYVYVFNVITPGFQFGAGALITRVLGTPAGKAFIIAAISVFIGAAFVWFWRDPITKITEAQYKISQDTQKQIGDILKNPNLTPEQKTELIKKILDNEKKRLEQLGQPLNWNDLIMYAAIGIGGLIVLSIVSKK